MTKAYERNGDNGVFRHGIPEGIITLLEWSNGLWTIPITFSLNVYVCCSAEAIESVMINELSTTAVTPVLF